jgi:hypothetical protein
MVLMEIIDELGSIMEAWLAENPVRNPMMLARKTGVSESTIRRLLKRGQNGQKTIELDTAESIVYLVLDRTRGLAFLEKHFPTKAKWRKEEYKSETDQPSLAEFIRNPEYHKIMMLCDVESGISLADLKEEVGNSGLRKLSRLVEMGIVKEENGVYKFSDADFEIFPTYHTQSAALNNFLSFYDPENAEVRSACSIFFWTQGLSPDAVRVLAGKIRDFEDDVVEYIKNKKNHGDIPWFMGFLQNVLNKKGLL